MILRSVHAPFREAVLGPAFTPGWEGTMEGIVRLVYEPPAVVLECRA
jgi:hypothetical protein